MFATFKSKLTLITSVLLLVHAGHVAAVRNEEHGHGSLSLGTICAKKAKLHLMCTQKMSAQTACIDHLKTPEAVVDKAYLNTACVNTLALQDLCVPGNTAVNSFTNCQKYRASATFSAPMLYSLGQTVNFDMILDDPNGNVSMVPFTHYTAPVDGYYVLTYKINQNSLVIFGGVPVLGNPVAKLDIVVNGVTVREGYHVYLTFLNTQHAYDTTLISLKQGDVVSFDYNVSAMDQATGVINLVGTVMLEGNGTDTDQSLFKIHYLSSDCPSGTPCSTIPCTPPLIECSACDRIECCEEICSR